MSLSYAHVIIDEKFIEGAISLFESDNRIKNSYFMVDRDSNHKYVKNINVCHLDSKKALDVLNTFDVVFIHSLPSLPLYLIGKINKKIKVVWLAWGYDMYEAPYDIIPINLLGPETKKNTKLLRLIVKYYWKNIKKSKIAKENLSDALSRIDYFSGVFPYEIDLIKIYRPEFRAETMDFYYGSASNFFIPEIPSGEIKHGKKNIIIGNCASITMNHLDVIKALSSIQIDKDAKIILPLSYSDICGYANKVEKAAELIAPGQIVSLRKYIPLSQYLDLISNCEVAFFACERQQASDNIFMQLLYGARVYMSETSAAFAYLKSIGLKVYSLQNEINLLNLEMTDEDVLTNRRIISSLYSPSKLIGRVRQINNTLITALNNE